MTMLTAYQCYRSMSWTTDSDECEAACGRTLAEGSYVEGVLGHYCSEQCRDEAETDSDHDEWCDAECEAAGHQPIRKIARASRALAITNELITRCQHDIDHGCDGPITAFVLISRATELAATGAYHPETVANALDNALRDYHWLVDNGELYETGT